MIREERIAFVIREVAKFDAFKPTPSVEKIAEAIVDRWEQDIECTHPEYSDNRCAEMSCPNYYGKR